MAKFAMGQPARRVEDQRFITGADPATPRRVWEPLQAATPRAAAE